MMCTVSWLHDEDGYHLLCNRDEQRSRAIAIAPRRQRIDGVEVLAPADGYFGGAWISANDCGVSFSLINGAALTGRIAPERGSTALVRSRGLFLMTLAASTGIDEALERFSRADLAPYSAFTVVALESQRPATILEWNGAERVALPYGDPYLPLASSSFDPEGVAEARKRQFARIAGAGQPDLAALLAFHRGHDGEPSAYSACMHRPDAETVSFSWITVNESQVFFRYSPVCACWQHPAEISCLARR